MSQNILEFSKVSMRVRYILMLRMFFLVNSYVLCKINILFNFRYFSILLLLLLYMLFITFVLVMFIASNIISNIFFIQLPCHLFYFRWTICYELYISRVLWVVSELYIEVYVMLNQYKQSIYKINRKTIRKTKILFTGTNTYYFSQSLTFFRYCCCRRWCHYFVSFTLSVRFSEI